LSRISAYVTREEFNIEALLLLLRESDVKDRDAAMGADGDADADDVRGGEKAPTPTRDAEIEMMPTIVATSIER
jgi:hypothetical protein